MKRHSYGFLALSLIAGTAFAASVSAQEPDPGHPRINQVENRLDRQEMNTMKAEESGQLTAGQANRDMRQDQRMQNQLSRDESRHGGHITKREQHKLNREMNKEKREKMRQERRDRKHREHRAGAPAGMPK